MQTNLLKILLTLAFFLMPFSIKYNNILLTFFILIWFFNGSIIPKINHYKKHFKKIAAFQLFFFITLLSLVYTSEFEKGLDEVVRIIPLFFLPVILTYTNYNKNLIIYKSIVYGSLTAIFICWSNVIYEMLINNEPIEYFFRWRHSNAQLTKIINTHPSYLSLYLLTSLAILFYYQENIINNKFIRTIFIVIISLFMFSLLARISLIMMLFSYVICIYHKQKYQYLVFGLLFGIIVFYITKDSWSGKYLKKRLIEQVDFSKRNIHKDKRLYRLKASYYTFLENPIIGRGVSAEDIIRRKYYLQLNEKKAFKENHNAHNQFMEYLSTYGLLGGLSYLITFTLLLFLSFKQKKYFIFYTFLIFFIANIFESMLERTNGIVFFSLFISLFLNNYISKK